jgi:hypothetical protein
MASATEKSTHDQNITVVATGQLEQKEKDSMKKKMMKWADRVLEELTSVHVTSFPANPRVLGDVWNPKTWTFLANGLEGNQIHVLYTGDEEEENLAIDSLTISPEGQTRAFSRWEHYKANLFIKSEGVKGAVKGITTKRFGLDRAEWSVALYLRNIKFATLNFEDEYHGEPRAPIFVRESFDEKKTNPKYIEWYSDLADRLERQLQENETTDHSTVYSLVSDDPPFDFTAGRWRAQLVQNGERGLKQFIFPDFT